MTFIIAEIGSNFKTIHDCIEAIKISKNVGADAVKFQLATEEELYGRQIDMGLDDNFIKRTWVKPLAMEAKSVGIEFMCSAFSEQGYSFINEYVNYHKIASCENTHPGILKTVAHFKKPTFVSLGQTNIGEINYIHKALKECPHTFLYCEVAYPSKRARLEYILHLKNLFGKAGYSDHTTDSDIIPVDAVHGYGARVIEKHFNPLDLYGTPDAPHSLDIPDFVNMVQRIRKRPSSHWTLKWPTFSYRPHKRKIVALQDIEKGEQFTPHNIGCYRIFHFDFDAENLKDGLSTIHFDTLLKQKSLKQYQKWDVIDDDGPE